MNSNNKVTTKEALSNHKRPASSSDDGIVLNQQEHGAATSSKKKKISINKRNKHVDPTVLQARRSIQACCARDDLVQAMELYQSVVTNSVRRSDDGSCNHDHQDDAFLLEPQTLYNLLNLCGGLSDRGVHIGTPMSSNSHKESSNSAEVHSIATTELNIDTRQQHAEAIMSHMRERKIPLTESCFTAMIKLFSKTNVDKAELLLDQAEQTQQCGKPRLRMYSPLLMRYCELGETLSALRVWQRLTQQDLTLSEREYTALLQCSCRTGNAALMERVLSDLSEEVMVPSRDARQVIIEWFQSPSAITPAVSVDDSKVCSLLAQIPRPYPFAVESMGPVVNVNASSWNISEECPVDSQGVLQTGCLAGSRLQPVMASPEIWEELKRMNETIVVSGRVDGDQSDFQGGRKGPKRALGGDALEQRRRDWDSFVRYLQLLNNESIDVVVDGANVGYFETNYAGAPKHVDYQQIDWIVQYFVKQHKSVMVFLNARHVSRPLMPPHVEPIVQSWRDDNVLYVTPRGMNDDWFWLHAALVKRSLVVTNDEMRDHHFQMLAPRGFLRWKDRHQVHFRFGVWNDGVDCSQKQQQLRRNRTVELVYPDVYSRRMQRVEDGLVVPMPKRGDENRFLDGSHQADATAPIDETYLCIRPNKN